MFRTTLRSGLAIALGLTLLLPVAAAAQAEATPTPSPILIPELEGLAWYRSIDTTGTELEQTRDPAEVDAWALLAERADASLDELEYTFREAFVPAALPDLGAMATVRVAGAETDALRAAVVQDIADQVVTAGGEAPAAADETIAGKAVTVLPLADALGYDEAVVYATGDTAYIFLLPREQVEQALDQLP